MPGELTPSLPAAEPFRLLVTGSRSWSDTARIWGSLSALADQMPACPLVVVHGNAWQGADFDAGHWARFQRNRGHAEISEEPHDADWNGPCRPECRIGHRRPRRAPGFGSYCPAAGDYRNQEMAESGIHACFGWIAACSQRGCRNRKPHGSHGATDCCDRAEEAGIPTSRWYTDSLLAALEALPVPVPDGRTGG